MTERDAVLCPECGWSGTEDDLVTDGSDRKCPVCAEVVEFVE